METVNIATMAEGAIVERLQLALEEAIDNVFDPNTDPSKAREVTVTLKLHPTRDRQAAACDISVKHKLQHPIPVTTMLHLGRQDGKPCAWENAPNQHKLNFNREGDE